MIVCLSVCLSVEQRSHLRALRSGFHAPSGFVPLQAVHLSVLRLLPLSKEVFDRSHTSSRIHSSTSPARPRRLERFRLSWRPSSGSSFQAYKEAHSVDYYTNIPRKYLTMLFTTNSQLYQIILILAVVTCALAAPGPMTVSPDSISTFSLFFRYIDDELRPNSGDCDGSFDGLAMSTACP